jgi:hypothetical protein
MHKTTQELPKTGYALVVDGRLKTEFETKEGAQNGAEELKRGSHNASGQGVRCAGSAQQGCRAGLARCTTLYPFT